jgi:plasmid maintenance system antidote protein VapI
MILHTQVDEEIILSNLVRDKVDEIITQENLNEKDVAKMLDLLPSGVEALFHRRPWPVKTAFRVASAFGIKINLEVE